MGYKTSGELRKLQPVIDSSCGVLRRKNNTIFPFKLVLVINRHPYSFFPRPKNTLSQIEQLKQVLFFRLP